MARRKYLTEQQHKRVLSDQAAAYIADALMQLALDFENNHYAEIRRHYEAVAPGTDKDPRQLELFPEFQSPGPSSG
jgi:hypothetical protein